MALSRREVLALSTALAGVGIGAVTGLNGCSSSDTSADGGSGGKGTGGSGSGGSSGSGGANGSGGVSGSGGASGSGGSGTGGASGSGGSGTGGAGTGGANGSGGSGTGGAGTGGASGSGGADAGQGSDAHDAAEVSQGNDVGADVAAACDSTESTIQNNHGHILMVSGVDVAAGVAKTYSIKGTSPHDHMVTVTAPEFRMLESRTAIMMTSTTTNGHSHVVMVMCA